MRILFQCAAAGGIQSLYNQCEDCLKAVRLLLHIPVIEVRLITKALLLCLPAVNTKLKEVGDDLLPILKDDEISELVLTLDSPKPLSFHGLTSQVFITMMKCLVKDAKNTMLLVHWGVPELLGNLSDRLTDEEDQELLVSLIWILMQFESGSDLKDASANVEDLSVSSGIRIIEHDLGTFQMSHMHFFILCLSIHFIYYFH